MDYHQQELLFFKQKIEEIKVALFKAESESVLQLPNNIISTLKVDEGYIWFVTSCSRPFAQCFDEELPVSLDYYQKGKCLRITGKAFIEDANEGISHPRIPRKNNLDHVVLLRVKILKAEYSETMPSANSIIDKIKTAFVQFYRNPYKMYEFSFLHYEKEMGILEDRCQDGCNELFTRFTTGTCPG